MQTRIATQVSSIGYNSGVVGGGVSGTAHPLGEGGKCSGRGGATSDEFIGNTLTGD